MAVPKQRKTKSRVKQRRANIKLKAPSLGLCPKCKTPTVSHTVCKNCGTYKNNIVIDTMKKLDKKERKAKEKEIQEQEKKPLSMEELSKQDG